MFETDRVKYYFVILKVMDCLSQMA